MLERIGVAIDKHVLLRDEGTRLREQQQGALEWSPPESKPTFMNVARIEIPMVAV